jgi:Ion channel
MSDLLEMKRRLPSWRRAGQKSYEGGPDAVNLRPDSARDTLRRDERRFAADRAQTAPRGRGGVVKRPAAFSQVWWEEKGLTGMLVLLVLAIFVALPLETLNLLSPTVVGVVMTLLLVSGVVAMTGRGPSTWIVGAFALASLVARWITVIHPGRTVAIWDLCLAMVALALLTAFVLRQVFRGGPITGDRIRGSILAYLLLGIIWCLAYQLINLLVPGAFRFPEPQVLIPGRLSHHLVYFSFITLTTVGYGDVTPVYPIARTLAAAEALVGQLYPAILIGRLVSLQISSRQPGAGQ